VMSQQHCQGINPIGFYELGAGPWALVQRLLWCWRVAFEMTQGLSNVYNAHLNQKVSIIPCAARPSMAKMANHFGSSYARYCHRSQEQIR